MHPYIYYNRFAIVWVSPLILRYLYVQFGFYLIALILHLVVGMYEQICYSVGLSICEYLS